MVEVNRACFSNSSIFSNVIDFNGMIFGLHKTSFNLPRSENTKPAFGRTSCNAPFVWSMFMIGRGEIGRAHV